MISVKSADLWVELKRLAKENTCIRAAVAYVSDDTCISFGDGDVLVVDASEASVAGGRTSASLLETAYKKGALLYSCDTLHGKVIVFDHHAYIGSANISRNSKERLDEIGVVTDHPNIMSSAVQLIDEFASRSVKMDEEFINRILKIDVKKSTSPRRKPRNVKIKKPLSWLLSIRNDADYPGNEAKVKNDSESVETSRNEESAWFWMRKGNRFFDEAKIGNSVVIIDREKKTAKKPDSVVPSWAVKCRVA